MIMSVWSVKPTTPFLGMIRPLQRLNSTLYLSSVTELLTTALLEPVEKETKHRKDVMINFHNSIWPDRVSNPAPLSCQSEALPTASCFTVLRAILYILLFRSTVIVLYKSYNRFPLKQTGT